jgi:hypothetical protein
MEEEDFLIMLQKCGNLDYLTPRSQNIDLSDGSWTEVVFHIRGEDEIFIAARRFPKAGLYWVRPVQVVSADNNIVFTTREYLDFVDAYDMLDSSLMGAREEILFDIDFFVASSIPAKDGPEYFAMEASFELPRKDTTVSLIDRMMESAIDAIGRAVGRVINFFKIALNIFAKEE